MGKIAAIILAAGYSSRMGLYKPLLPLASSLVLENSILNFYKAGIDDVRVVIGYKADLLKNVLERWHTKAIVNRNYDRGMYSSVQAGVLSLTPETEAFFVLPADYPFVTCDTIQKMIEVFRGSPYDVIYPVFNEKKGHPPLISSTLRPDILESEPQDGLREILGRTQKNVELPVDDAGIMLDLDSEDDYRKILPASLAHYPCRSECEKILQTYNVSNQVLRHTREVARVAGIISEYLNSRGFYIHLGLVMASALLHDIAKGEKYHPQKGQQIIASLDYPEVAEVIATHMDLPAIYRDTINEHAVVYLADKMVREDKIVSLTARMTDRMAYCTNNAIARKSIIRRLETAINIQKNIESKLNVNFNELFNYG